MAFVNEQGSGPQQTENVADLVLEKKKGTAQRGRDYSLRLCIYKPGLTGQGR
jgi:hypothetical protein